MLATPLGTARAIVVPNDPLYDPYQWNLRQIHAPEAWDLTTGSPDVIIAVLDTGVSFTHPDLANKLVPGYDFVNDTTLPDDDNGNGTHVAGIIAAETNNQIGIAGITWLGRIMPVKVLDAAAHGDVSLAAQGVIWAVDHGARVINLGLAGPTSSQDLVDAIDYAHSRNVVVIAPVANNGTADPSYPAALDHVIAVAATDHSDRPLTTSNSGDYISVAAPGDQIASTFRPPGGKDGYAVASGTAQAAAHVAGVAALLLSINPDLSTDDVQTVLEGSADHFGLTGRDSHVGFGRINAARALAFAAPWNFYAHGWGAYDGLAAAGNDVYFPIAMKSANGWSTSHTIQNPSPTPTNANAEFFDQDGHSVYSYSLALAGMGSTTIDTARLPFIPTDFIGSLVVHADTPIVGVANEDRRDRDRLTYEGLTEGATRIAAPLLMRAYRGWDTGIQIQNLGAAQASVRVTLYTRGETAPLVTEEVAVLPYASATLYQGADESLPEGWVGSCVIDSLGNQLLVAVVNEVNVAGPGAGYVGVTTFTPQNHVPLLFKRSDGVDSGMQVQNAGPNPAAVTVTYARTNGSGGPWVDTANVDPGGSTTFYQPASLDLPNGFAGSATLQATGGQALGLVVNEVRSDGSAATGYNGFPNGSPTAFLPLLYKQFAGWNSDVEIQNLGQVTTMISTDVYDQDGNLVTTLQTTIDVGASTSTSLHSLDAIPSGYIGAAVVKSTNDVPIAVIAEHIK